MYNKISRYHIYMFFLGMKYIYTVYKSLKKLNSITRYYFISSKLVKLNKVLSWECIKKQLINIYFTIINVYFTVEITV